MGCGLALDELAPLEGRLPHLTRVDLSANLLGRRPPSAQARGARARARLRAWPSAATPSTWRRCASSPRAAPILLMEATPSPGALARGLRKRNAPPLKIMLADNAFTAGAWREVLSALALRPPSDTLDVSRPAVLGSASERVGARSGGRGPERLDRAVLDDADALALHAGRPAARGPIEMLSVTGRTAATELATVLASFAVEAEIERVAPHAILTELERSDVLKHLSARGCRLRRAARAAGFCAPALSAGRSTRPATTRLVTLIDLGACLLFRACGASTWRSRFDPQHRSAWAVKQRRRKRRARAKARSGLVSEREESRSRRAPRRVERHAWTPESWVSPGPCGGRGRERASARQSRPDGRFSSRRRACRQKRGGFSSKLRVLRSAAGDELRTSNAAARHLPCEEQQQHGYYATHGHAIVDFHTGRQRSLAFRWPKFVQTTP